MAMNKVQFQKGLSLDGFLNKYGSEAQCEEALVAARWPHGYQCPRCACQRVAMTHNGRRLWECLGCGYQCSAIAGTVMSDQTTATQMVSVDVLDDPKQKCDCLAGTQTAIGCDVQNGVDDKAQIAGSDGAA